MFKRKTKKRPGMRWWFPLSSSCKIMVISFRAGPAICPPYPSAKTGLNLPSTYFYPNKFQNMEKNFFLTSSNQTRGFTLLQSNQTRVFHMCWYCFMPKTSFLHLFDLRSNFIQGEICLGVEKVGMGWGWAQKQVNLLRVGLRRSGWEDIKEINRGNSGFMHSHVFTLK